MSQSSEYGKFEWVSPTVDIGEFKLTYLNSRIRTFGAPWEHLDHVEFTDEEGRMCGMTVTEELMDVLTDHEFPSSFDYYPDRQTQEWWLNIIKIKLHEDIEEVEGGSLI